MREARGVCFDVDARVQVPNDGSMEPNSIAQVVETGYMIHDRVLRDAKVGVVEKGARAAPAAAE